METEGASPRVIRFGVFELDLRAGELRKSGLKVRLREQSFQILAMLLERPGEVVTREELQQKLWPNGTFVDFDHSLNTAVNRIREALGDTADNPRFIETLPRRGYRFIAPVEVTLTPAPAPPGIGPSEGPQHAVPAAAQEIAGAVHEPPLPRRRALALTAGGLVAVAALLIGSYVGRWRERLLRTAAPVPIDSIAVLPLENLSHDPEQEYFADGMTEELITTLGKIGSLRVISRTSVKQYKGTKKPLPDIARELGVDAIVEGTVLRSGNRVRITANLLHAPNDRHLWAETYERDLHDVLVLQGEVARAIANEVQIKLAPGAKMRLWGAHSVKPEAYETYLKGTNKCDVELLEKAVKLDPDYAPAYAALAGCTYIPALFGGLSPSQAFPKIKESALSALERDDTLAEAHGYLGLVRLHYEWDWAGAEREIRRALELNPSEADIRHVYVHHLMAMGRAKEAVTQSERAVELDPFNQGLIACLGWHCLLAHQYDQAREHAMKALQMDPDDYAHLILGCAYEQKSMLNEAIAALRKAVGISNGWDYSIAALGHALAAAGKRGQAQETLARLIQQSKRTYVSPYYISAVYAGLGDKDHAFEWLQKAYAERSAFLVFVQRDPWFDNLHSDTRFSYLVRQMGLPP